MPVDVSAESFDGHDQLAWQLARIAISAGTVIASMVPRECTTSWKRNGSPVTEADLAAERVICRELADLFPDLPIVSEEQVSAGDVPLLRSRFALVDPLDGTREFVAGRDEFTVNMAIIEAGHPIAGAIFAPLLKQVWFGGQYAYRLVAPPGTAPAQLTCVRRIHVSRRAAECLTVLVSRTHPDTQTEAFLKRLGHIRRVSMGSSLKFCRIAEGSADIYPRLGVTCEWDTAAGAAVLCAAGGRIIDLAGQPLSYGACGSGFRHFGFIALGGPRLDVVRSALA